MTPWPAPVLRVGRYDPTDPLFDPRKLLPDMRAQMSAAPGSKDVGGYSQIAHEATDKGLTWFAIFFLVLVVLIALGAYAAGQRQNARFDSRAEDGMRRQAETQDQQNSTWLDQVNALRVQLADADKRHGQELEDQAERHRQHLEATNNEHRSEKEAMRVRHNEDRDFYERDRGRLLDLVGKLQTSLTATAMQALTTNAPSGLPAQVNNITTERTDVRT